MKMPQIAAICCALSLLSAGQNLTLNAQETTKPVTMLEDIHLNRDNQQVLNQLLPIVKCSFKTTKYEEILMTTLRDKNTSMQDFRRASDKLSEILIAKLIENIPTTTFQIETPITHCVGVKLCDNINLVSIMRSGDALLETFAKHFPTATISKILIQRDETTAEPNFKYMKLAPNLGPDSIAVITEPMIATGGTLGMVISLLKEKGVLEENIIIASVCAAPEGLMRLNQEFPKIGVVMIAMDDHLNERKYIVPGLGDFGDRFFGTIH